MENMEALLTLAARFGTVPALLVAAVMAYKLRRAFGKTQEEALDETIDELENKR